MENPKNTGQIPTEQEICEAFKKRTLDLIEKEPVNDPRMEQEIRENVRVICDLDGFSR